MSTGTARGQIARRRMWLFVLTAILAVGLIMWGVTTTGRAGEEQPSSADDAAAAGGVTDPIPAGAEDPNEEAMKNAPPPEDIAIEPDAEREALAPKLAKDSEGPLPELEPVEVDQAVISPSDIQIELARLESVQGQAVAAGETSGAAIRATIRITNKSHDALDLGYVVVTAYHGDERTPVGTLMQPGGQPFTGSLPPGKDATGVYLFSLAGPERGDVTLVVDYQFGEPSASFRGRLE